LNAKGNANVGSIYLPIPPNTIVSEQATLNELAALVGPSNISMDLYVSGSGYTTDHLGDCTHWLDVTAGYGPTLLTTKVLSDVGQGSKGKTLNESNWTLIRANTSDVITGLMSTGQKHSNIAGACGMAGNDIWAHVYLNLKIDVKVYLFNFCTKPKSQNIRNPVCFNYMSGLLQSDKSAITQNLTDYLADYCQTKYPSATLQMFMDPTSIIDVYDKQICACNMNQKLYDEFNQSLIGIGGANIGSVRPACVFPTCLHSPFKNIHLDSCPPVQCINGVTLNGNKITGSVTVTQDSKCPGIKSTNTDTQDQDKNKPQDQQDKPQDQTQTQNQTQTQTETKDQKNNSSIQWGWIILGIIVLVLVIYLFYTLFKTKSPAISSNVKPTSMDYAYTPLI
jgi:hypothetical protein